MLLTKMKKTYSTLTSVSKFDFWSEKSANNEKGDEELARRLQEQYGGYIEQHMQEREEKKPAQEESKF